MQEPYTAVGYLAQWLPMLKILKMERLEQDTPNYSAVDICEGMQIYFKKEIYRVLKMNFSLGIETWIFNS